MFQIVRLALVIQWNEQVIDVVSYLYVKVYTFEHSVFVVYCVIGETTVPAIESGQIP